MQCPRPLVDLVRLDLVRLDLVRLDLVRLDLVDLDLVECLLGRFFVVLVVVLVLTGGFSGGGPAAGDALPSCGLGLLACAASGAVRGLGLVTRPLALEQILGHAADDHDDVAGALADAGGAAARTRAPALQRRTLVRVARGDIQLVDELRVVVLRVGNRRSEALADRDRGIALTELQDLLGLRDIQAADEVEHRTRLRGGHADVARLGARARTLVGLGTGHRRALLS